MTTAARYSRARSEVDDDARERTTCGWGPPVGDVVWRRGKKRAAGWAKWLGRPRRLNGRRRGESRLGLEGEGVEGGCGWALAHAGVKGREEGMWCGLGRVRRRGREKGPMPFSISRIPIFISK
jgi:hypothetical protein